MFCEIENSFSKKQIDEILFTARNAPVNHLRTSKFGKSEKQGKSPGSRDQWSLDLNSIEWLKQHVYELIEKSKSMIETKYNVSIDVSGGVESRENEIETGICSFYSKGDSYTWHTDANRKTRTLSIVIQLTEGKDYENGDLQVRDYSVASKQQSASRKLGNALIFTPDTLHRVTETTKGIRKSLIFWIHNKLYDRKGPRNV